MIRRLPRDVVDRIAAGEVIERPASVVKELLENALDAGAERVTVEVEKGGKQLLRISDDGSGMALSDLRLAFVPHATSKLSAVDDLLAIASYGFRGEALSSIGAVSRARVVSRTAESREAFEISCEGGAIGEPRPLGAPVGTVVEVRNLFFNVPARARFLKGDPAEASRCLDHVIRVALASEGVAFVMKSDGRVVFEVAGNASRRDRLAAAFGHELGDSLIAVARKFDDKHVEALLGKPDSARSTATHQFLFVNGRLVKDSTLRAAVRQAYRAFLAASLQPVYCLLVTIDPAEIDVNVHPAKTEIRFRNSKEVFRAVYHVVLETLRGADLAPRPGADAPPAPPRHPLTNLPVGTVTADPAAAVREPPPALPDGLDSMKGETPDTVLPIEPMLFGTIREQTPSAAPERTGRGWLRLFSTYILYESADELVVVDQHALDERVLFERLRRQLDEGAVLCQRLLVPEVVEVGRPDVLRLEELADDLGRVGLEATAFGDTAVAVHAVPALLNNASPEALLRTVFAGDDPLGRGARAHLEETLHTMACHGAVRAGDHLEDGEIEALLAEAGRLPEAKACPHGRPTSIRLSRSTLERWFHRR